MKRTVTITGEVEWGGNCFYVFGNLAGVIYNVHRSVGPRVYGSTCGRFSRDFKTEAAARRWVEKQWGITDGE